MRLGHKFIVLSLLVILGPIIGLGLLTTNLIERAIHRSEPQTLEHELEMAWVEYWSRGQQMRLGEEENEPAGTVRSRHSLHERVGQHEGDHGDQEQEQHDSLLYGDERLPSPREEHPCPYHDQEDGEIGRPAVRDARPRKGPCEVPALVHRSGEAETGTRDHREPSEEGREHDTAGKDDPHDRVGRGHRTLAPEQ